MNLLEIPEPIIKEYLIRKNYEKPKIKIGDYYLDRNYDSSGNIKNR
jgi:hypothetical protein